MTDLSLYLLRMHYGSSSNLEEEKPMSQQLGIPQFELH